jgi:ankyrin repeat protein
MKKLIDLGCSIDEIYEQRISYPYTSLVNQDAHDIVIQQMTPLMMCAYINDYVDYRKESTTPYDLCTIPQLLLDHGADVNATDSYGNTTLHHVAASISISANQRTHFIKLLLKRKADINQKNNDGKTPLYYASIAYNRSYNVSSKKLVTYLLRKNAEIDKTVSLSPYIVTQSY